MRVQYFKDTDTALIELGKRPVVETREVGEDVYLDLDEAGRIGWDGTLPVVWWVILTHYR